MNKQDSEAQRWPVIINQSLADSEIYRLLQQRGYKLRGKVTVQTRDMLQNHNFKFQLVVAV